MKSIINEIAPDIYRISTYNSDFQMQINQFLIKDDQPFLMHTSFRKMFPDTIEGLASVIEPSTLRWIGFSHFEADECGALNEYFAAAPSAQAACSFLAAAINVEDFTDRPAKGLKDGEVLDLGKRKVRFLATPHVPHCWDAGLFFEETTGTLLSSDLFFHPGNPSALTGDDILNPVRESILSNLQGPFAKDFPWTPYSEETLTRLARLEPKTIATMHGSSFSGNGSNAITELTKILKENLSKA